MIIRNLAVSTILAAVAFGVAGPVLAAMPASHLASNGTLVSTLRVSYADLNLASAAGQATLAHRIAAATKAVCNDPANPRAEERCRNAARLTANRQVALVIDRANAPMLASR